MFHSTRSNPLAFLALVALFIPVPLLTLSWAPSPEPPSPASKEIRGTHTGAPAKDAPYNMVLIPTGMVRMGLSEEKTISLSDGQMGNLDALSRSIPESTVQVKEFFCDLYEVTNAQFKAYLDALQLDPPSDMVQYSWAGAETYPKEEANMPVRNVSLREARAFSRWCGKRIPTEEEWSRAAAGDDGRDFAWGNDWDRGKKCKNKYNRLSPVGSYEDGRSPFGVYDMTGSVWEWTESNFEAFPKWKAPSIKVGKQKMEATPGFNGQCKVVKGGHYLLGSLQNLLHLREGLLPSNNLDSLGFRCVKDVNPGATMLRYAWDDLDGGCVDREDCDSQKMYAMEVTKFSEEEPKRIIDYDYFLLCPLVKAETTAPKIEKESPDKPQPFAVLSTNRILEEPNLPPGSYVLAYRHEGLSEEDKKADYKEQQKLKEKEEEERRKKEEEEAKKEKERKEKLGIKDKAKTQEEIEAEKRQRELEEQMRKEDEEAQRQEEEARRAQERLGLISGAKNHIDFPRNKNLIVFMNANDTIVGYLEVLSLHDQSDAVPLQVNHTVEGGKSAIQVGLNLLSSKVAKFDFTVKIKDNPF